MIIQPNLTAPGRCAIAVALLAVATPGATAAQRLVPAFPTQEPSLQFAAVHRSAALTFGHPDDYRWEGVLVGGVGLGLFSAFALGTFCSEMSEDNSSCAPATVGGLVLGGFAGVVVGGLLGGLIPKAKP